MRFTEAREYVMKDTGWVIDDATIQVLDAQRCLWVALAETTHLAERGEPERHYAVLVEGSRSFIIEPSVLPGLGQWCLAQKLHEPKPLKD